MIEPWSQSTAPGTISMTDPVLPALTDVSPVTGIRFAAEQCRPTGTFHIAMFPAAFLMYLKDGI